MGKDQPRAGETIQRWGMCRRLGFNAKSAKAAEVRRGKRGKELKDSEMPSSLGVERRTVIQ
jgi:hypothetical protein